MFCFSKKNSESKRKFCNVDVTADSNGEADPDMPMPRLPNGQLQVIIIIIVNLFRVDDKK